MNLPDHWEELPASTKSYDSGRNYDKPMYIRKDGYARIYHNVVDSIEDYEYAIVFACGTGDCAYSLPNAILRADIYIAEHQAMYVSIKDPRKELF
jgi:hypothetical protein